MAEADFAHHEGNVSYRNRMSRWAAENSSDDANYEAVFGAEEAAKARQEDAVEASARRSRLRSLRAEIDHELG